MPLVQEREARQLGAMMIMQAAILLRLPSQASACALSIFHRFYYSSSFFECDVHLFSMASLFLAAKLEETPRKYKDVISVFDIVKKQFAGLALEAFDLKSYALLDVKEKMMDSERMLIKNLGFQMQLISHTTTHKHLVKIVTTCCITSKELLQKAWTLANDSYLGPLCVLFPPS